MAKLPNDGSELNPAGEGQTQDVNATHFDAGIAENITVSNGDFLVDSTLTKDGYDLIMTGKDGQTIIIDNYFLTEPQPNLFSAEGHRLSPDLVKSFLKSDGYGKFAAADSYTDESAIGLVTETNGEAIVTRTDGSQHTLEKGMAIFQGDIIETEFDAAVNITFIDESSFSIGEDARMAIDEFIFDPATNDGTTNVSILRGVFMYTSGLIGRDNPDSVEIDTPAGSIGIRGTIIGGKIMPAGGGETQITVIEGAIVVTNASGQHILSSQFETVRMADFNDPIENIGQLNPEQMNSDYGGVRSVSGNLFSSIDDSGNFTGGNNDATGNENGTSEQRSESGENANGETSGNGTENNDEGGEGEASGEGENAADGEGEGDQSYNQDGDFGNDTQTEFKTAQNINNQSNNNNTNSNYDYKASTNETRENWDSKNTITDDYNNNPNNWDKAPEIRVTQTYSSLENNTNQEVLAKLDIRDPNQGDRIDLSRINIGGNQNNASSPIQIVWDATNKEYLLVKRAGYSFDFENFGDDPTGLDSEGGLNIRIWDDNTNNWNDYRVPIEVLNANEAPTLEVNYRTTTDTDYNILENGQGSRIVARLRIEDPDKRAEFNDNRAVVSDNRFEVVKDADGNAVLRVKNGITFDYENESAVNLQLHIEDKNDSSLKSAVYNITVNVKDIGDTPTDITLTNGGSAVTALDENTNSGALIGRLNTIDQDSGENFTYALSGPDAAQLTIVNGNELRLANMPNHEAKDKARFRITVTDKDGLTYFKDFTININDLNEGPTDITLTNGANTAAFSGFDENLPANTVVATLLAQDPDSGDTFTFALDASADASKFIIDGNQIKLNQVLSYEDKANYSFNVTVTDSGGLSFTKAINLNLNDLQEAPVDISLNNGQIFEDYSGTIYDASATVAVKGAMLGRIEIDDPEDDNFAQADIVIEHPTDDSTYPMGDYIEIVPVTNGYLLKLKDDVLIHKESSSAFRFVKGGLPANFYLNGDGNGHFPIDFKVTVNDYDAGASYDETFKLTIKDNIIQIGALNGNDGFIIENDARNIGAGDPNAYFGRAVTVGDFDGNGAWDIVTGAPEAINSQGENAGGYYVHKGNPANPYDVNHSGDNHGDHRVFLNQIVTNSTIGYFREQTTTADDSNAEFADKVINLGDVNGDGLDDLLITAPGVNKAYIHFGHASAAGAILTLTNLPNASTNDITIASVGDVNGDGLNDVIFGSPNFSGANTDSGVFNIFYGKVDLHTEGSIDYTGSPSNVTNHAFEGSAAGDHLGSSIAGIGDFNGDGYDDFIVSAPDSVSATGRAYLYHGGVSAPTQMVEFNGPNNGSRFGQNVTGIGDINGDGLADLMISAPNLTDTNTGGNGVGQAYVVFGTETALPTSTSITGFVSTAANGFTIRYGAAGFGGANEHLGTTMSAAGDFNGDGYDDFVITGMNGEMVDAAFLVYGGFGLTTYLSSNSNILNLQDILGNGSLGMRLQYRPDMDEDGNSTQDQIVSVSAAGDLNKDGFDDIIMGFENANDHMGETYVIYGRDSQGEIERFSGTTKINAVASKNYIGNHENNYLYDNMTSGLRVDTAAGDDKIKITSANFDFIDGGAGFDELRIFLSGDETGAASSDVINLRGLEQTFKNIEEFFIDSGPGNGGFDELHINISDVLDLLQQADDNTILFSTDQGGNGRNNIVKFYDDSGSNQALTSLGFTNDANGDTAPDTVNINGGSYYKYTLTGTDYAVLLDSQLGSSAFGGSV